MTGRLLRIHTYGYRWHVFVEGRGIVFSWNTKRACLAYCRRHNIEVAA